MLHPSKLLKELELTPKKSLSQNFLINTHSLNGAEDHFKKDQPILEIGAGLGAVTEYFIQQGFKMFVCEKDPRLASYLEEAYKDRFQILNGDFLKIPADLWKKYFISQCVSNLPFHLTTDMLICLTLKMSFIQRALLGVQLEFAKSLLNKEKSSSLSILIRTLGKIKTHKKIKKTSFFPRPKFDACWIFWERDQLTENLELFEKLLKAAYWGKRKSLINSLKRNPFFTPKDTYSSKWLRKLDQTRDSEILDLLQHRADSLVHLDYIKLFHYLESA